MDLPGSPNGEQVVPDASSVTAPESRPVEHQQSVADVKPSSADSSPAKAGVKEPQTVYEAVTAVLSKQRDEQTQPASTVDSGGESPSPAGEKGSVEPGEAKAPEAGKEPVKDANTRIRELVAVNKDLAPKAQHFDQISQWVHSHGLTQQDFTTALELRALSKLDPLAALTRYRAEIAEIERALGGSEFPQDIQESLDAGRIDEEYARELAQSRKGGEIREAKAVEIDQTRRQAEFNRMTQDRSRAIGTAVTNAESTLATTDPDYPRIKKYVVARVQEMLNESVPQTPEEAVQAFRKAVTDVKKDFAAMTRRPTIQPLERPDAGGTAPTSGAPRTALEAAKRALESMQT